jgi:hypothetical protein
MIHCLSGREIYRTLSNRVEYQLCLIDVFHWTKYRIHVYYFHWSRFIFILTKQLVYTFKMNQCYLTSASYERHVPRAIAKKYTLSYLISRDQLRSYSPLCYAKNMLITRELLTDMSNTDIITSCMIISTYHTTRTMTVQWRAPE